MAAVQLYPQEQQIQVAAVVAVAVHRLAKRVVQV
jgi:Na+-transporting methylmalonyl-CoA/oxaloacetate decarboxylase gamma subunit